MAIMQDEKQSLESGKYVTNAVDRWIEQIARLNQQEEEYHCPKCQQLVPKREFILSNGKQIYVQPICDCESHEDEWERKRLVEHKRKVDLETKYSVLGHSKYGQYTLDNFIPRAGTEEALAASWRFIEQFDPQQGKILYLHGGTGAGKSHLAAAIGNHIRQRYVVVYKSVAEILEQIRASFSGGDREHQIMEALATCDLLILDDLGVERTSDWSMDVIHRIIDRRVHQQRSMIITSNYSLLQLKQRYTVVKSGGISDPVPGDRIISRISQGGNMMVYNGADDYRMEAAFTN